MQPLRRMEEGEDERKVQDLCLPLGQHPRFIRIVRSVILAAKTPYDSTSRREREASASPFMICSMLVKGSLVLLLQPGPTIPLTSPSHSLPSLGSKDWYMLFKTKTSRLPCLFHIPPNSFSSILLFASAILAVYASTTQLLTLLCLCFTQSVLPKQ